jgi:23S rRNA-/tRNA-specific pseudouridylate synthase
LTGYEAPRVMLHARRLSFTHPGTEKRMSFEAPLPEDFREALKSLRVEK